MTLRDRLIVAISSLVLGVAVLGLMAPLPASVVLSPPSLLNGATNLGNSLAGAHTNSLTVNLGDTNFSQGGVRWCSGATPNCQYGWFTNFGGIQYQHALFAYLSGDDRIEAYDNAAGGAPLLVQPNEGFMGVGKFAQFPPSLLSVSGGSLSVYDPTSLGAETLTSGGANFSATNDCTITTNTVTCSFSAGTASTITQASGTLATKGKGNRVYKFVYTATGVTGTPTATITGTWCNAISAGNSCALSTVYTFQIQNGTSTLYFPSVAATGNFVVTTTLTAGQAFTLNLSTLSLKETLAGGAFIGSKIFAGDCQSTASPAVCGAYAYGSAVIAAGATTVQVNTTAMTAVSTVTVSEDQSLSTKLGVTCNTQSLLVLGTPRVTARSASSFTVGIDVGPTTNPLCFGFNVVN